MVQELSENNFLSTIARLGKEWWVSAQLRVPVVRLHLTSVASFIYLENSSIQYQGSWTKLAVHQTIFYPSSYLQVIGRSLAPHHQGLRLWIVNSFTGEISSCFNNCSGSVTLRRLDLRDAGDYDPRQRIHRCADIGHQLLHLPPLLYFIIFSLTELSGVHRPPLFGLPILWTAYLLHLTWWPYRHIWPFMAIWPIRVFFECALRVHCVVWWGICNWVEMMLFLVTLGWMVNSSRVGEHWQPRVNIVW